MTMQSRVHDTLTIISTREIFIYLENLEDTFHNYYMYYSNVYTRLYDMFKSPTSLIVLLLG